jgi:hypothetical protein
MDTVDLADLQPIEVLMTIDDVPAHLHRKVGEGHVFLLAFDFGMAMTALQQGIPGDDFSIPPISQASEAEAAAPFTIPERLVENPKLRQATAPYADLLERHVLYAPLRFRPAPRMWLFPETMMGALAMTHDEGGIGDKAAFMSLYEHEHGWTSTYFISPSDDGISNQGLDALRSQGAALGLAWHRGVEDALYTTGGIGRLKPFRYEMSLIEQHKRLEGWAGQRVHIARARNQRWDRDYTLNWRKMAAAGVFIDSTYGPGDPNSLGYLFGTGLPFLPIDRNSLPLPVYEIPYILSDTAGLGPDDRTLLIRFLRRAAPGSTNCSPSTSTPTRWCVIPASTRWRLGCRPLSLPKRSATGSRPSPSTCSTTRAAAAPNSAASLIRRPAPSPCAPNSRPSSATPPPTGCPLLRSLCLGATRGCPSTPSRWTARGWTSPRSRAPVTASWR